MHIWSRGLPAGVAIEARTVWPLLLLPFALFGQLVTPHPVWVTLLTSIVGVDTPRSHLGRVALRRLLKVRYVDARGRLDSAAWLVSNVEEWLQALRGTTRGEIEGY